MKPLAVLSHSSDTTNSLRMMTQMLYEDEGLRAFAFGTSGPHSGSECYVAHPSQAIALTDDSLTNVGQRSL